MAFFVDFSSKDHLRPIERMTEDALSAVPTLKADPFASTPRLTFTTTNDNEYVTTVGSSINSSILRTLMIENTTDCRTTFTISKLPASETFRVLPLNTNSTDNSITLDSGEKYPLQIQWIPSPSTSTSLTNENNTVRDTIVFNVQNKRGKRTINAILHGIVSNNTENTTLRTTKSFIPSSSTTMVRKGLQDQGLRMNTTTNANSTVNNTLSKAFSIAELEVNHTTTTRNNSSLSAGIGPKSMNRNNNSKVQQRVVSQSSSSNPTVSTGNPTAPKSTIADNIPSVSETAANTSFTLSSLETTTVVLPTANTTSTSTANSFGGNSSSLGSSLLMDAPILSLKERIALRQKAQSLQLSTESAVPSSQPVKRRNEIPVEIFMKDPSYRNNTAHTTKSTTFSTDLNETTVLPATFSASTFSLPTSPVGVSSKRERLSPSSKLSPFRMNDETFPPRSSTLSNHPTNFQDVPVSIFVPPTPGTKAARKLALQKQEEEILLARSKVNHPPKANNTTKQRSSINENSIVHHPMKGFTKPKVPFASPQIVILTAPVRNQANPVVQATSVSDSPSHEMFPSNASMTNASFHHASSLDFSMSLRSPTAFHSSNVFSPSSTMNNPNGVALTKKQARKAITGLLSPANKAALGLLSPQGLSTTMMVNNLSNTTAINTSRITSTDMNATLPITTVNDPPMTSALLMFSPGLANHQRRQRARQAKKDRKSFASPFKSITKSMEPETMDTTVTTAAPRISYFRNRLAERRANLRTKSVPPPVGSSTNINTKQGTKPKRSLSTPVLHTAKSVPIVPYNSTGSYARDELTLKNWLNTLLAPAVTLNNKSSSAPLAHTVPSATVTGIENAAKLFAVRLEARLKRYAYMKYHSTEFQQLRERIQYEIMHHKLVVRNDKLPHADPGLRARLVSLFLTYEPAWLKLGLETVFGENIGNVTTHFSHHTTTGNTSVPVRAKSETSRRSTALRERHLADARRMVARLEAIGRIPKSKPGKTGSRGRSIDPVVDKSNRNTNTRGISAPSSLRTLVAKAKNGNTTATPAHSTVHPRTALVALLKRFMEQNLFSDSKLSAQFAKKRGIGGSIETKYNHEQQNYCLVRCLSLIAFLDSAKMDSNISTLNDTETADLAALYAAVPSVQNTPVAQLIASIHAGIVLPPYLFTPEAQQLLRQQNGLSHTGSSSSLSSSTIGRNIFTPQATFSSLIPIIHSTKDVFTTYSRELLRGEGDLLRHLHMMNVPFNYTQSRLEEALWSIQDVTNDLRDGSKLVRLAEILSNCVPFSYAHSSMVRVPAHNRNNKLHNVAAAFQLFTNTFGIQFTDASKKSNHGTVGPNYGKGKLSRKTVDKVPSVSSFSSFTLSIAPRDIVDGNQEKIIELLWSVLGRVRLPSLISNERLTMEIQALRTTHAATAAMLAIQEEQQYPAVSPQSTVITENTLLQWVQSVVAIHGLRIPASTWETAQSFFADGRVLCNLIAHYQPSVLNKRRINKATIHLLLQNTTNASHSDTKGTVGGLRKNIVRSKVPVVTSSGTAQQLVFRLGTTEDAIQSAFAAEHANFGLIAAAANMLGCSHVALTHQDHKVIDSAHPPNVSALVTFIAHLARLFLDVSVDGKAATRIQRKYRSWITRKQTENRKRVVPLLRYFATLRLVAWYRKLYPSAVHRHQYRSAVAVQRVYRGYRARQLLRSMKEEKERQRIARREQFAKRLEMKKNKQTAAISHIIAAYRGYRVRKQLSTFNKVVVSFQAAVRGYLARYNHQLQRTVSLTEIRKAVVVIQAHWRSYGPRQQFLEHWNIKRTQPIFTNEVDELMYNGAAQLVIASLRSAVTRRKYIEMRAATMYLQAVFRGYMVRKWYLDQLRTMENARLFNETAMLIENTTGTVNDNDTTDNDTQLTLGQQRMMLAAEMIQAAWRGYITHQQYRRYAWAINKLKATFRMHQTVRFFVQQRSRVIQFQALYRGHMDRKLAFAMLTEYYANPSATYTENEEISSTASETVDDTGIVASSIGQSNISTVPETFGSSSIVCADEPSTANGTQLLPTSNTLDATVTVTDPMDDHVPSDSVSYVHSVIPSVSTVPTTTTNIFSPNFFATLPTSYTNDALYPVTETLDSSVVVPNDHINTSLLGTSDIYTNNLSNPLMESRIPLTPVVSKQNISISSEHFFTPKAVDISSFRSPLQPTALATLNRNKTTVKKVRIGAVTKVYVPNNTPKVPQRTPAPSIVMTPWSEGMQTPNTDGDGVFTPSSLCSPMPFVRRFSIENSNSTFDEQPTMDMMNSISYEPSSMTNMEFLADYTVNTTVSVPSSYLTNQSRTSSVYTPSSTTLSMTTYRTANVPTPTINVPVYPSSNNASVPMVPQSSTTTDSSMSPRSLEEYNRIMNDVMMQAQQIAYNKADQPPVPISSPAYVPPTELDASDAMYLHRLEMQAAAELMQEQQSVTKIQSTWRGYKLRRNFMIARIVVSVLKAYWRGRQARKVYQEMRLEIIRNFSAKKRKEMEENNYSTDMIMMEPIPFPSMVETVPSTVMISPTTVVTVEPSFNTIRSTGSDLRSALANILAIHDTPGTSVSPSFGTFTWDSAAYGTTVLPVPIAEPNPVETETERSAVPENIATELPTPSIVETVPMAPSIEPISDMEADLLLFGYNNNNNNNNVANEETIEPVSSAYDSSFTTTYPSSSYVPSFAGTTDYQTPLYADDDESIVSTEPSVMYVSSSNPVEYSSAIPLSTNDFFTEQVPYSVPIVESVVTVIEPTVEDNNLSLDLLSFGSSSRPVETKSLSSVYGGSVPEENSVFDQYKQQYTMASLQASQIGKTKTMKRVIGKEAVTYIQLRKQQRLRHASFVATVAKIAEQKAKEQENISQQRTLGSQVAKEVAQVFITQHETKEREKSRALYGEAVTITANIAHQSNQHKEFVKLAGQAAGFNSIIAQMEQKRLAALQFKKESEEKLKQEKALRIITRAFRRNYANRQHQLTIAAIISCQAQVRRWLANRCYQVMVEEERVRAAEAAIAQAEAEAAAEEALQKQAEQDAYYLQFVCATVIQKWYRQRMHVLNVRTEQFIDHTAITRVQAWVRGWFVRKRSSVAIKQSVIRARIANVQARKGITKSLAVRCTKALQKLSSTTSLTEIMNSMTELEICTRLSNVCSNAVLTFNAPNTIIGVIRICDRTKSAHVQLIRKCLAVLRNIVNKQCNRNYQRNAVTIITNNGIGNTLILFFDLLEIYRDTLPVSRPTLDLLYTFLESSLPAREYLLTKPDTLRRLHQLASVFVQKLKLVYASQRGSNSNPVHTIQNNLVLGNIDSGKEGYSLEGTVAEYKRLISLLSHGNVSTKK